MTETHKRYLRELTVMPKDAPDVWPAHMVELFRKKLIQRIGNTIYLTEKGQEIADTLDR